MSHILDSVWVPHWDNQLSEVETWTPATPASQTVKRIHKKHSFLNACVNMGQNAYSRISFHHWPHQALKYLSAASAPHALFQPLWTNPSRDRTFRWTKPHRASSSSSCSAFRASCKPSFSLAIMWPHTETFYHLQPSYFIQVTDMFWLKAESGHLIKDCFWVEYFLKWVLYISTI